MRPRNQTLADRRPRGDDLALGVNTVGVRVLGEQMLVRRERELSVVAGLCGHVVDRAV